MLAGATPLGSAAAWGAAATTGQPPCSAAEWLAAVKARVCAPKRPPPPPPCLVERLAHELEVGLLQAQLAQARAGRDAFAWGLARLSGRAFTRELLIRCVVSWYAFRDGRGRRA